jgi:hypothetical protein
MMPLASPAAEFGLLASNCAVGSAGNDARDSLDLSGAASDVGLPGFRGVGFWIGELSTSEGATDD